ncbi:hypothetical protein [Haloarcula argentinensis]|uniref:hypothetical protein n=1 Tax=Haloarcula argentinensis TaxID=43776 RepID=UPI000AA602B7|nr:hypothetical protein [Haloarcula argentinensis]
MVKTYVPTAVIAARSDGDAGDDAIAGTAAIGNDWPFRTVSLRVVDDWDTCYVWSASGLFVRR